jgi:phosphoribosylformylglycinamidine cyclo-ligase
MYQVFNMGHRMEIYTDESTAESVISIATKYGLSAQIVGRCEAYTGKKLTLSGEHGSFEYH